MNMGLFQYTSSKNYNASVGKENSLIPHEQGSHLTPDQEFLLLFGAGTPTLKENLTKLHSGTPTFLKSPWGSYFENPSENPNTNCGRNRNTFISTHNLEFFNAYVHDFKNCQSKIIKSIKFVSQRRVRLLSVLARANGSNRNQTCVA